MRRICLLFLILFLLTGCTKDEGNMDQCLQFRQTLLAQGCSFDAVITADYGDSVYQFGMQCQAEASGTVRFQVTEPQSIAGITGVLEQGTGALTFDEQVLAFSMLADQQITPVSAPWIVLNTLRSGYLTSCGVWDGGLKIAADDSYQEDALHLDIWTDGEGRPGRCEILWRERRIITLEIENFAFL